MHLDALPAGVALGSVGVGAAVFCLAAYVQAVTGFGAALAAMPLLALATDPMNAVFACTLAGGFISGWACRREHPLAARPLVVRLTCWALAGVPVGLALVSTLSDRGLRYVLVAVLLAAIVSELAGVRLSPRGAMVDLCGLLSGALLVGTGINGPPLVMALRRLEPERYRATLQATFFLQDLAVIGALVAIGRASSTALCLALGGLAGIPLGWALGTRTFGGLSAERLRLLVIGGLAASAVAVLTAGGH